MKKDEMPPQMGPLEDEEKIRDLFKFQRDVMDLYFYRFAGIDGFIEMDMLANATLFMGIGICKEAGMRKEELVSVVSKFYEEISKVAYESMENSEGVNRD